MVMQEKITVAEIINLFLILKIKLNNGVHGFVTRQTGNPLLFAAALFL